MFKWSVRVAATMLLGGALAACGSAGGDMAVAPAPGLHEALDNQAYTAFVNGCEARAEQYAPGDIAYPRTLKARMGDGTTYEVALTLRGGEAGSPSELISAADPDEQPVRVQCLLAARLVTTGEGLSVATPDEAADGGWVYQQFTPAGAVEWAWAVTPQSRRDQQLRLELRPAMQGLSVTEVSATNTARFVTEVNVESSWLQRLYHWFKTEWPLLVSIAVAIGGAVVAVIKWGHGVREAMWGTAKDSAKAVGSAPTSASTTKSSEDEPVTKYSG